MLTLCYFIKIIGKFLIASTHRKYLLKKQIQRSRRHLSLQGQRVTCYIRKTSIEVVHRSRSGGWVWFCCNVGPVSIFGIIQGFVCCFSCAVDMAVWQIPTPFAWGHFHHYFKNLWILLQASRNSLFVLSLDMTLTSIFLAYFLFSLIFLQDWQKLAMKANIYIFCTICYIFRWSSFDWPVHFFHFRNFCSSTWSENRMGCHQRYLWLCRLRGITH